MVRLVTESVLVEGKRLQVVEIGRSGFKFR